MNHPAEQAGTTNNGEFPMNVDLGARLRRISAKRPNATSHCRPFSHALTAAL